jgi:uncharacterized protein (DUF1330 family)
MPAYVIVDANVTDPDKYTQYREAAGPVVAQYGGRYIVRGGATTVLEGDWNPGRVVVAEFPDVEAAKSWYDSPEYQHARSLRQGACEMQMLVVEGA